MNTMNIALPDAMKQYIHEQVAQGGYSSVSEYVRELIRTDQTQKARRTLEAEILKGLSSGESSVMTEDDWQAVRQEIRRRHARGRPK